MGFFRRALILSSGLYALSTSQPAPVQADDWQVSRSEFDPRLIAPLKAELRKRPEDQGLLRRLMGLYKRHSSLDVLAKELLAQAEKSNAGADYFLLAQFERERGRIDEAIRLTQLAGQRDGGPDPAKAAMLLADLALRRAPPDLDSARKNLEGALPSLKAGDARRPKLLRRLADLYGQSGDAAQAVRVLNELLAASKGAEAMALHRELAEALSRANKPAEALAEWRHLAAPTAHAEQRAEAELHIGELSETTRDDMGALAAYRRGLSLLPAQHHLRRELYEHLIALHRKRDELPLLIGQLEKELPAPSRSFADWELLGRLYDERGDTSGATSAYRSALHKDPHNIDVRRRLIALLERSGVSGEVLHEYEQLIAQAPGDSRAYLELAERLDKSGQRQQALAWLRRAAVRFAGDPSLHSALSDIYQRWGEADLALSEAELLVRLDPRDESYIVNLGEMYWARGRKEKADEIWRRLLSLSGNKPLGQAKLADVYAEHNLMPQAMDLYQKAVKAEPNNLQLRRGLALASERLSRPAEAIHHWEQIYFAARVPAERPLRLEARQHLGKLIRKETRLLPSLYTWQRRLQAQLSGLASDKLDPPELLALGLLVADLSLQVGQTSEAEDVLVKLEKRLPDGPLMAEVLLALVPVYQQQRKLDEAIDALKRAAALLPDRRRELYAQLADLSLQGYHDEDAIKYAQQAVVDAQGELRLGEIFERRDDNAAAMAAYRRAIELDSHLFRAHMALARLHLGRGELTEAAAIYRDVVRQSPQEELVLEAGRKAIDLHEYMNTLGELLRELTPLAYAPVPKPVYRKLLLFLYERHTAPLIALSRGGDAAAQAELLRLGQSSFKPLAETLVEGDNIEQRLAVTLLSTMGTQGAAPALLNLAGGRVEATPARKDERAQSQASAAHPADIDLRVDALMAAARLDDPHSLPQLMQLANSNEKQLRLGALYGLMRLAHRVDRPAALIPVFEQALNDFRGAVKALGYLGLGAASTGKGLLPRHRAQIVALLEKRRTQQADDVDETPAAAAVHALGQARERSAVPLLIELLREGNDEVQRQAAWSLGVIADPRAVGPLLRAVFVKSDPVRQVAAQALRQIGTPGTPGTPGTSATNAMNIGPGSDSDARRTVRRDGGLRHPLDAPDVSRWLGELVQFPPVTGKPLWLQTAQPTALLAALDEALLLHRDIALRTLLDLLEGETMSLGPLGEQVAALPADAQQALRFAVAQGILPTVSRLARGQAPQGATIGNDPAVRDQALLLLGRFATLPEPKLRKDALEAVLAVAHGQNPQVPPILLLRAVEVLANVIATLPSDERTTMLDEAAGLLDRLVEKPADKAADGERWVRLSALETAERPGASAFLSTAALRRAAEDSDGFVREAAQRLLKRKR